MSSSEVNLIDGDIWCARRSSSFSQAPQYSSQSLQTNEADVLIHVVNAAGLSAFNPVKRQMAPLSHDLAGFILPHDHYSTHQNSSGKTVDEELEKSNFLAAAEALSDVWSNTVIVITRSSAQQYQ